MLHDPLLVRFQFVLKNGVFSVLEKMVCVLVPTAAVCASPSSMYRLKVGGALVPPRLSPEEFKIPWHVRVFSTLDMCSNIRVYTSFEGTENMDIIHTLALKHRLQNLNRQRDRFVSFAPCSLMLFREQPAGGI